MNLWSTALGIEGKVHPQRQSAAHKGLPVLLLQVVPQVSGLLFLTLSKLNPSPPKTLHDMEEDSVELLSTKDFLCFPVSCLQEIGFIQPP